MLIEFSVKNFRSIKEKVVLSFKPNKSIKDDSEYYFNTLSNGDKILKLALIYGANASGKTNILRALSFLRSLVLKPRRQKTDALKLEPFLFDEEYSKNKDTEFTIEFFQNDTKYLYEVTLNTKAIVKENLYFYSPKKSLIYERLTDQNKELSDIKFGQKIKIKPSSKTALLGNTLWNNTVLGSYLKTNFESKELQDVINWFNESLKLVVTPRIDLKTFVSEAIERGELDKNILVNVLQKADLRISDIILETKTMNVDDKFMDFIHKNNLFTAKEIKKIEETKKIETKDILFKHIVNDKEFLLRLIEESDGTQRYYGLAGLLSLVLQKPTILPIDEIESSLHPDLLKHFLLTFLLNSKNSQIIATTHNRELLMEKDLLINDFVWLTEKLEDASTDLYCIADFKTDVIRDTSSIYNAYKIGKLGAKPVLGDTYISGLDDEEE